MRQFLVVGHDAPTTPDFSLSDLPGGAGRLDLLARCVTTALLLSHGIREDVHVSLVLADEYTVRFDGSAVRRLNPDERSTAALVRTALENREEAIGHQPVETSPGVSLRARGFEPTLEALADGSTVVQLHDDGDPITAGDPPAKPLFVLSDHRSFTEAERESLAAHADRRHSLGPRTIHADHAISVAHNYLDTDGFTEY